MIPFLINQVHEDFEAKEEERKQKVIERMVSQRTDSYDGVPDYVWEAQLKLELMTKSELMLYAIRTPPTFIENHGCTVGHLTRNLHTTDDQGFEGQVMERADGSKWFCRWFEQEIGFDREALN